MPKSYCDFMDEITADELYEGLLAYGLFADKLPPVFTSVPFFNYCKSLSPQFAVIRDEFISFRTMRNVGIPRQIGIPTPMSYQQLCAILRDNWNRIQKHFHEQTDNQSYRVSRIHIRKKYGSKSLFEMNYKNWRQDGNPESELLIHDKGVSRFLVKADVSTCFPSIYTHSIPWALVGKAEAKKNARNPNCWYNMIDKACQTVKYGETHGLLIGPHASNVVSELILTVVDRRLYEGGYRYVRNIDDYDCYVENYEQAERFLRELEEALRDFDLPLNHKKTKILKLPIGVEKNWKHQLNALPAVGRYGVVEYPQVNTFIDTALKLANETVDYAIINYAIKKLASMELSDNARKLAGKRFIHLAVLFPYLLPLMEDYVFVPYNVEISEIKSLSDAIYNEAAKTNDYERICYAIYFALRYNFHLDKLNSSYVVEKKDCITLVLIWLYFMNVNHWKRDATEVKPLKKEAMNLMETDMGRYWLFCYETLSAGVLSGEWKKLKLNGVSFIKDEFMRGRD